LVTGEKYSSSLGFKGFLPLPIFFRGFQCNIKSEKQSWIK